MTLNEIPADIQLAMTAEFRRLFHTAGCDPACHFCKRAISDGELFMLAEVLGKDEMLGSCCTKEQLLTRREREAKRLQERERQAKEYREYRMQHPGYTRPHLISSGQAPQKGEG